MKYIRKDRKVNAKVLNMNEANVLFQASWKAQGSDFRNFRVVDGQALNTLVVSKHYFDNNYEVLL